jgi:hypothetical protein
VLVLLLGVAQVVTACAKSPSQPVLDTSGSITGTVLQENGSVAANADLYATGLFEVDGLVTLEIGFSDAAGQFTIGGLPPGAYLLHAVYFDGTVDAETLSVPHAAAATTTLHLVPGGLLKGTASPGDGTQKFGTIMTVPGLFSLDVTDSLGGYRLTDVPPGAWKVTTFRVGYVSVTVNASLAAAGDSTTIPPITFPVARPAP